MDAIFSFKFTHLAEAQRRRAQVRNGERGSVGRQCFLYYDLRQSPLLLPIVEGGQREIERERENEREIRNAFANAPHTILRQKFCANESAFLGVVSVE